MLRNGEQLILAIVLPLMALVGLTVTPLLDGLGGSRVDVAVPGILALCAMSTAFTGQGISTGFDRRYGVLRFLSTTPLGRTGLIAGKILAVLAVLLLQVLVVGAVAFVLGWHPTTAGWAPALVLLVLGAAAFTALGLLVAGTVRPEATLAITNLLWILLGALGGIVIPAERLPGPAAGTGPLPALRGAGRGPPGCLPRRHLQWGRHPYPAALDGIRRRSSHPLVQVELRKP